MLSGSPSRSSAGTGPAKWAAIAALSASLGSAVTYWFTRGTEQPPPGTPLDISLPAAEPRQPALTPPPRVHKPEPAPGAELANVPAQQPNAPPPAEVSPGPTPRPLDLNSATQAELELLPGIGPATAKAIIDFRRQLGGFKSVDDLDKVPGIGAKTLNRVRPYLRLNPG
ncbi:MAG: helix-hairpin-helix domain-containing protein [Leptolyngbya sp. PLA1]|nr:helix-hairpin-helix domain-containing protein [Leptolyngbya sp. PLA1]